MDISEVIIFLVVAWIVIQVGHFVINIFDISRLEQRVDVLKRLREIIHQVKIEKHGEMEYWYDADNNNFLGQGKTLEDVVSTLKSRFPDHIFLIEDQGGIAEQTGWKLMAPDEFKKIELIGK